MRCTYLLLISSLFAASAQSASPQLLLSSDGGRDYRINTADDYSLRTRTAIAPFRNIRAGEVSSLVARHLSAYGRLSVNDATNELVITEDADKLKDLLAFCTSLDRPEMKNYQHAHVERIPVRYGRAADLVSTLSPFLSTEGRIAVDNNFNALVVTDVADAVTKIRSELSTLDKPQRQVVIDLEIVEVERGKCAENGIDWDNLLNQAWIASTGDLAKGVVSADILRGAEGAVTLKNGGAAGGATISNISSVVRFMQEHGAAKILATPKMVTVTGRRATLWYGEDIRYSPSLVRNGSPDGNLTPGVALLVDHATLLADSTRSSNSSYYSSSIPAYTGGYRPENGYYNSIDNARTAGLDLGITPTLGESDLVSLDFNCSLTSIRSWTPQGFPVVTGQNVNASLIGRIGQPLLIGGLKRTTTTEVRKRVPGLGVILPFLFSRKVKEEKEVEMAIIVTPRVLDLDATPLLPKLVTGDAGDTTGQKR